MYISNRHSINPSFDAVKLDFFDHRYSYNLIILKSHPLINRQSILFLTEVE
jgi:hypothetical protein